MVLSWRDSGTRGAIPRDSSGGTADVWSCPGFNELGRDGVDAKRHNRLDPQAKSPQKLYVTNGPSSSLDPSPKAAMAMAKQLGE